MAKKKKWIKSAIKHPGRETRRAEEHGISVHQQLERDANSSDRSLDAAGNLGLRFEKGIGHKHKSKTSEERARGRYGAK